MKRDLLVCVDNPERERPYTIAFETSEFTALYEKTRQPIFATIEISYTPNEKCLEQMSLKHYLGSFRDDAVFCEGAMNRIADDLIGACDPAAMTVTGRFTVRGGITTQVQVCYVRKEDR